MAAPASSSSTTKSSRAAATASGAGFPTAKTGMSFIVFISSLFDKQISGVEARPMSELLQYPTLPHRHIVWFRLQVNLLYFLRSYLNVFLFSLILTCLFLPWLTGAVVLAGLMHLVSSRRGAGDNANSGSGGGSTGSSNSSNERRDSSPSDMEEPEPPRSVQRLLSSLQAVNCIFLLYYYGVLKLLLVLTMPALVILGHATMTSYNDKASSLFEAHSKRLQQKASSGGDASGKDGKNGAGSFFSPPRPSTPVRRWGNGPQTSPSSAAKKAPR